MHRTHLYAVTSVSKTGTEISRLYDMSSGQPLSWIGERVSWEAILLVNKGRVILCFSGFSSVDSLYKRCYDIFS